MFYGIWCYLKYFLFSKKLISNKNLFLHKFKNEVLNNSIPFAFENKIDDLRLFYKEQNLNLINEDYGAGSRNRKVQKYINTKHLVQNVAVSKKYGRVLYKLVKFINAENILELGTSLGIGSAYLSACNLTSIEGNTALYEFTKNSLISKGYNNINFINAQFDKVLHELISKNQYDLVYIDGNHTYEATKRYFELFSTKKDIVLIFDDIYWNKEMTKAWKYIKNDKNVSISLDLFKFGIVFLDNKKEQKNDYKLWY